MNLKFLKAHRQRIVTPDRQLLFLLLLTDSKLKLSFPNYTSLISLHTLESINIFRNTHTHTHTHTFSALTLRLISTPLRPKPSTSSTLFNSFFLYHTITTESAQILTDSGPPLVLIWPRVRCIWTIMTALKTHTSASLLGSH